MRNAHPFALRLQFADAPIDIGVVQPAAAAQRAVEVEIGVLADAGAVIHQADHAHQRMIGDGVEQRQHVQRGNLAAQMQEVLGLQQIGIVQRIEIDHAILERAHPLLVEAEIAEAQRIEHRGDAGRGALRVVRDHRRARRPACQRARLHLAFQIVGVGIDDAGDQVVAVEVVGGGRAGAARLHVGDATVSHHQCAVQRRIGQHQDGVGEDRLVVMRHPASGVRANSRSAIASRTSASWQIATMAVPRAFASLIIAMTTARFSASSEAVGSSSSSTGWPPMKPRARFTRCCSPPENVAGGSPCSRRGMFSRSSSSVAMRRAWSCGPSRSDEDLRDDVERRHARHHAQELADIAEGRVADGEDGARIGGGEVDHLAVMADQDVAGIGAVVAIQAAHQRGLAGARRPGQHHALACMQFEADTGQDGNPHAALQMQREALRQRIGAQHQSWRTAHACNTELTSNCV